MGPKNIERQIKDMEVEEYGYTLPWAMDCEHVIPHNLALNLVIRGDYSVCTHPSGTARMLIQRTENGVKVFGFSVEDYEFHFSSLPFHPAWHSLSVEWVNINEEEFYKDPELGLDKS